MIRVLAEAERNTNSAAEKMLKKEQAARSLEGLLRLSF